MVITSMNAVAQEKQSPNVEDVTKATFFSPGISYEKRVGKNQTLTGSAFMATSFEFGFSSALGTIANFWVDPGLSFRYRYYYNYERRQNNGKRTALNSLNYMGAFIGSTFSKDAVSSMHYVEENRRPINRIGLVWGFQRNYKRRFSLDFNAGLGYLFTKASVPGITGDPVIINYKDFTIGTGLTLGFWLNRRK